MKYKYKNGGIVKLQNAWTTMPTFEDAWERSEQQRQWQKVVQEAEKRASERIDNEDKGESYTDIPLDKPISPSVILWNINDSVIVNGVIPIQQEVAKEYGLQVIDLHTLYADDGDKMVDDGIHPDGKGARRMAEIIFKAIKP